MDKLTSVNGTRIVNYVPVSDLEVIREENYSNESSSEGQLGLPSNKLYLRDQITAVQKIKSELGICNQAAVEPMTFLAIGSGVITAAKTAYDIYKSWNDEKVKEKAIADVNNAVTNAIGALGDKFWNNDLLSTASDEVTRGIQKIRTDESLVDSNGVAKKIEMALEKLLISEYHLSDKVNILRNKQTVRGLILALEGLYQRSDFTSSITNSCDLLVKYLKAPSTCLFLDDEKASLESIRRILVENLNAPLSEKIPNHQNTEKNYRLNMYQTILATIIENRTTKELTHRDPLYLRSNPPDHLQDKVREFRNALVNSYRYESGMNEGPHKDKHSYDVVKIIEEILTHSTEISELEWSETAKKNLKDRQNNELRFAEFKKWADNFHHVFQMSEEQLKKAFNSFTTLQQQSLGYLPDAGDEKYKYLEIILQRETYFSKEELNEQKDHEYFGLQRLLKIFDLETKSVSDRLDEKSLEKGLFIFRYLNALMDKKIIFDNDKAMRPSALKNYINDENRQRILKICKRIVHDEERFPSTLRSYDFFTIPHLTSIPGQALALHRKLSWHIDDKEGYVDLYGLKKSVLENAVRNLYPKGDEDAAAIRSFLLSGPPGTGKSSFAVALANHLAIPLFVLKPTMITIKKQNVIVLHEGVELSLNDFFKKVRDNSPSLLLIDEIDELASPRKKVKNDEQISGKFLSELETKGQEGLSQKTVVLMTTNMPLTETIDISTIDDNGYSGQLEEELDKFVDTAILREGRADKKIFTFHKLYSEQQGQALAMHFFGPYVKAGKISGATDFTEAGRVLMNYTPAVIEKVFEVAVRTANGQITQQQMLDELKKHPGLLRYHVDPQIKRSIETTISILVNHLKVKKLEGNLDYRKLSIVARDQGLDEGKITEAISKHTPETLTQENIIAAFEHMGKKD